jgi:hypothetical protein
MFDYECFKLPKKMIKKLLVYIVAISCFASCKSQNKEETIQFDLNTPKIYYPDIGELRGKIKEITETMSSKMNNPIGGKSELSDNYNYTFDYNKNILYFYIKDKLWKTIFSDKNWLIDSSIQRVDSSVYDKCYLYFFKSPFHETYLNYRMDDGVKYVMTHKIDSSNRTVGFYIDNRLSSVDSFDVKNRLIQRKSFDFKDTFTFFKYNDEGDIIAKYLKMPNQEMQTTNSYEYEYDQNRNWIKKINTNKPDDPNPDWNTFKTIYERKIIYNSN